jgi:hypothetical protein
MPPGELRDKSIVKSIEVGSSCARLASGFINNIHTMSSSMPGRYSLGLSIKTKIQAVDISKPTHRILDRIKGSS